MLEAIDMVYDIICIGGGPAAYSAAIYGGRAGLDILIVDEGMGGGQLAISPLVENFPGFHEITGFELAEKMKSHALKYAKMAEGQKVQKIRKLDDGFEVVSGDNVWNAKTLLEAYRTRKENR